MACETWFETTIGEQATLQRGIDITKAEQREGRVPVISSGGVSSYHDTAAVKGPGVMLGRKGVVGSVYFIDEDYWPHDTSLWVKDFHGNHPRFVYYFFKSIAPRLAQMDVGSANPTLNRNHVHPIPISWPPLPEQKAIARILGTLDDKIELNRRMNATLEAMARALFQSWFVDFDPARRNAAKMKSKNGKVKNAPSTTASHFSLQTSHFDSLFPASFQDSELGRIPESWSIQPLSELCSYLNRGIGPSYLETGGVLVLNQKCIRDHRVNHDLGRRHNDQKKSTQGRLLERLDVLVNSTGVGTLGRVAQVFQLSEPTIVDSHVTIVRANAVTDPHFLGVNLVGRESEIEGLGEGSTGQTELSRVRLGILPVITPPLEIQNAFGRFVRPIFDRIAANENQSRILATLRDTLLPKLLSGELLFQNQITP